MRFPLQTRNSKEWVVIFNFNRLETCPEKLWSDKISKIPKESRWQNGRDCVQVRSRFAFECLARLYKISIEQYAPYFQKFNPLQVRKVSYVWFQYTQRKSQILWTFRSASLTLSANCPQTSSAGRWNSNSDPTIAYGEPALSFLLYARGGLLSGGRRGAEDSRRCSAASVGNQVRLSHLTLSASSSHLCGTTVCLFLF